ncbi:S9 family peptidase [Rhodoplanes sp. TEM]|uniref:S9 family peptidase n=1 Tax=Rhodoplanes tepidamans TaxID=200616 RepID=A0ABT5JAR3_RHOTP|nr:MULTISPECIES: S9 family peptidase [Rhodoplanes]MDC7786140.1 S9 family peptidase [Rhodoplanes tepidamans]MDC7982807.1 S9 family peptidase [Rhodoplanes sp. TEM]MDQ0357195.1 oligopeptidase B [Rhodoplanes tepidamans]
MPHGLFTILLGAAVYFGLTAIAPSADAEDPADRAVRPPVARKSTTVLREHGRERPDPYDWLANRDDPDVTAYLNAENAYAERRLEPIRPLIDEIAAELRDRRATRDASVPYRDGGYLYERRFAEGAQYPVIVRRRDAPDAPEEIVLDVPALAAGHAMYRLGRWRPSPDGRRVAFMVDFTGDRQNRLFVRDIATGAVTEQGITDGAESFAFAADSETLFYVRREPVTLRGHQVWRHQIGTPADGDVMVYEERDPTFSVAVHRSKSGRYILLESDQERTSEVHWLPADRPEDAFQVVEPRRAGLRYEVDHVGDTVFVRTDLDAPDFRIMTAPEATPGAAHWRELVPQQPGQVIRRMEPFRDFLAWDVEDQNGLHVKVMRLSDRDAVTVPQPAAIGVATTNFFFGGFGGNREPDATVLRFRFSAPLTPERTYDFDMVSRTLALRREEPAAWLRPDDYAVERIEATAPDGERVPVTITYRRSLKAVSGNPTLVVGYGAYGFSQRPVFNETVFSLLDRGFVHAMAHVRGGHEKGERWHREGRGMAKRNSFTDLIAVGEALAAQRWATPRALFARGGSAGGLLVAAAANLRPDLFTGIVAEVPFVDVVTTTSDPSIPLTTLEWVEWGNPKNPAEYDNIRAWSPYDNIEAKAYPAMFVTAGWYDSQVRYAEPAKWVARLRATRTDRREILFKTDMGAGHSGRSGRLGTVQESAEIMAWLVSQAGRATGR